MTDSKRNTIINYAFILITAFILYSLIVDIFGSIAVGLIISGVFTYASINLIFSETIKQSKLQQQYLYSKPLQDEPQGFIQRMKKAQELYPMYANVEPIPSYFFFASAGFILASLVIIMAYRAIYLH